jgi:hypothetical protein
LGLGCCLVVHEFAQGVLDEQVYKLCFVYSNGCGSLLDIVYDDHKTKRKAHTCAKLQTYIVANGKFGWSWGV